MFDDGDAFVKFDGQPARETDYVRLYISRLCRFCMGKWNLPNERDLTGI